MDDRIQSMLRDPDLPFADKAHLLERLDDTRAAYAVMVEGLESELRGLEVSVRQVLGDSPSEWDDEGYEALRAAEEELELWRTAGGVRQGSDVVLTQGRALMRRRDGGGRVELGTQGWVSWVGQRDQGLSALVRVGDDRRRGFYARLEDLEVRNPWAAVKRLKAEQEALEVFCPASGDQIRHLPTGRTGEVFWVSRPNPTQRRRLGFLPSDPQSSDQTATMGRWAGSKIVWAFAAETEVLTSWDPAGQGNS